MNTEITRNTVSLASFADFANIIAINEYAIVAPAVEAITAFNAMHAEALALNKMIDQAVVIGTTSNINCWPNAMNHAVDHIRDALFAHYGKVQARFVVKMMISVRRLAREATDRRIVEWQEILARPAVSEDFDSDIPF